VFDSYRSRLPSETKNILTHKILLQSKDVNILTIEPLYRRSFRRKTSKYK
jgi:hypothetical protein